MLHIVITDIVAGQTLLYEYPGRQGHFVRTKSFLVTAHDSETNEYFEFSVTRRASRLEFGEYTDRYDTNGECPPTSPNQPYEAFASETSKASFCLRLYEKGIGEKQDTLRGQGTTNRTNIMIHKGPGMSAGCFLIAGGKKSHRKFERWFKPRIKPDTKITVTVLPLT